MSQSRQVPSEEFVASMRAEVDQYLEQVMEAVNQAPDGAWISGSEEKVRDLVAAMRRRIFEQAVQKRIDAAEAAFPPSASSGDGPASGG
jgi:chloramphenicol 3-O-phosphotransferase